MNVPLYGDEYRKAFGNFATLSPSAQDEPNMTVKISDGGFWSYLDGVAAYVEYASGSSPIITAPVANAKWVVVCMNRSGMVVNINGAAAASPVLPVIPRDRYPIALVYVQAGVTRLTRDTIFDARPVFSNSVRSHLDLMDTTETGCHPMSAITDLATTISGLITEAHADDLLADKADNVGTPSAEFKLNQDLTGDPSEDCYLTVERGDSVNVSIRWNEASEEWEYTNDGATWTALSNSYQNDGTQEIVLKETTHATTPPTLTDGQAQIWINSDDSKVYLIFKPTGATQVKVELT